MEFHTVQNWRWSLNICDEVFMVAIAAKNYHIQISPLQESDFSEFKETRNLFTSIAAESQPKCKYALRPYQSSLWT